VCLEVGHVSQPHLGAEEAGPVAVRHAQKLVDPVEGLLCLERDVGTGLAGNPRGVGDSPVDDDLADDRQARDVAEVAVPIELSVFTRALPFPVGAVPARA
jgi:hypothetical protein